MKAYVVDSYGQDARFREVQIAEPTLKPGHVIIDVKASSLNPVDHKILTLDVPVRPEPPAILHMDVAGIVSQVGEGVSGFKIGDAVYGCAGGLQGAGGKIDGALADFMLADASLLAQKPKSLDFATSAALPLVSITAWQALMDRVNIGPDDRVLVHAATGGVGHIGAQLAKQAGAQVFATVSTPEKAALAKSLGLEDAELIYYRDEPVDQYVQRLTNGEGFDVVFDTLGGDNLETSMRGARNYGQVVGIVGTNRYDLSTAHAKSLSLHFVFMLLPMLTGVGRAHHGYILTEIAKRVDRGELKPLVHPQHFTFSQANEAHALYARNGHTGKIVLVNA